VYYNFAEGLTDEEEARRLATEQDVLVVSTVALPRMKKDHHQQPMDTTERIYFDHLYI